MQSEQKTSVETTQIAICVANMLNDYLIKEQQTIKTEGKNNDSAQNSESSYIKTSLCLFETVNNGTGKAQSGKY
ncbi:hypothetical protein [Wolbachia endosymbiont (group A) of Pogonocherus hispidulus]|uniref:hypothetical protein n=1 Tax=Wolbachia endosymbiont (group A) of Pogonocherus hispidulus TaxID=3066136 RepID=UPI00334272A5